MRRRGATAMTGEFDMGEGQVPRKGNSGLLSFVFSIVSNDIHDFGRGPVSADTVDRKRGCVD